MKTAISIGAAAALAAAAVASVTLAQPAAGPAAAAAGAPAASGQPPARPVVYPPRPVDPLGVERGKVLYMDHGCAQCHGAETRGGTAPGIFRRALVLNDVRGEKIGPVLLNGVAGAPNHVFKLEPSQIVDIADFIHSQRVVGTGNASIMRRSASILTGSASAGRAYFQVACARCHSAEGDLKGLAARITDPRSLQQRWLAPPATKPVMATVALPGGPITGEAVALDEFQIVLKTASGERTIALDGARRPRVTLSDPLEAHAALLRRISDKDIHDVTAYLVTLK